MLIFDLGLVSKQKSQMEETGQAAVTAGCVEDSVHDGTGGFPRIIG